MTPEQIVEYRKYRYDYNNFKQHLADHKYWEKKFQEEKDMEKITFADIKEYLTASWNHLAFLSWVILVGILILIFQAPIFYLFNLVNLILSTGILFNLFYQKAKNKAKELENKSENTLVKFEGTAEKFNQAMDNLK